MSGRCWNCVGSHKFQLLPVWNQAVLVGLAKEPADALAAAVSVIERPVIDVHPHEFIGKVASHVARELQRMLHRLGMMVQAVLDARCQDAGNFL